MKAEKGEAASITSLCHFYKLHRYLDMSWAITAENLPLMRTDILGFLLKPWAKFVYSRKLRENIQFSKDAV